MAACRKSCGGRGHGRSVGWKEAREARRALGWERGGQASPCGAQAVMEILVLV